MQEVTLAMKNPLLIEGFRWRGQWELAERLVEICVVGHDGR